MNKGISAPVTGTGNLSPSRAVNSLTKKHQEIISKFLNSTRKIEENSNKKLPDNAKQAIIHLIVLRNDLEREIFSYFPYFSLLDAKRLSEELTQLALKDFCISNKSYSKSKTYFINQSIKIADQYFYDEFEKEQFFAFWNNHYNSIQSVGIKLWRNTAGSGDTIYVSNSKNMHYLEYHDLINNIVEEIKHLSSLPIFFDHKGKKLDFSNKNIELICSEHPNIMRYLGNLKDTLEKPDLKVVDNQNIEYFDTYGSEIAYSRINNLNNKDIPKKYRSIYKRLNLLFPNVYSKIFGYYFFRNINGGYVSTKKLKRNVREPKDLMITSNSKGNSYYSAERYYNDWSNVTRRWFAGFGMYTVEKEEHSLAYKDQMKLYPGTLDIELEKKPKWFCLNLPQHLNLFINWMEKTNKIQSIKNYLNPVYDYENLNLNISLKLFDRLLDKYYLEELERKGFIGYAFPNDEIGGPGTKIGSVYWYVIKDLKSINSITARVNPELLWSQSERQLNKIKIFQNDKIDNKSKPVKRLTRLLNDIKKKYKDKNFIKNRGLIENKKNKDFPISKIVYYKFFPLLYDGNYFGVEIRNNAITNFYISDQINIQ